MPNFNQCTFMGHLTRDPEFRQTTGGMGVVNFGIAVNHKYKDKEEVCFLDCKAFGSTADFISRDCRKGDAVFVSGRLTLEQWTSKSGERRSKHALLVNNYYQIPKRDRSTVPDDDYRQDDDDNIPF